jgi:hypothetical protein
MMLTIKVGWYLLVKYQATWYSGRQLVMEGTDFLEIHSLDKSFSSCFFSRHLFKIHRAFSSYDFASMDFLPKRGNTN